MVAQNYKPVHPPPAELSSDFKKAEFGSSFKKAGLQKHRQRLVAAWPVLVSLSDDKANAPKDPNHAGFGLCLWKALP